MDYNSVVMEEFQHPSKHYKDVYKKIKMFYTNGNGDIHLIYCTYEASNVKL